MATISIRGALLRSLPVLLLLVVLALSLTAPQALASAGIASAEAATDVPDTGESDAAADRTAEGPIADRTRTLTAQHTAGVTGSRAPPLVRA